MNPLITISQRMLLCFLLLTPCIMAWEYDFERGEKLKKWVYLYTTTYEMVDRIIDDLCEEYWELCPFDEDEMIVLKREILDFNDNKEYTINELLAGFPSKYKKFSIAIQNLKKLGKKLYASFPKSVQEKYEDIDDYIFSQFCFGQVMKHVKENKKYFEIHEMTDEQIQKALMDHEMDLIDKFHINDPDYERSPEKLKAALRSKHEL